MSIIPSLRLVALGVERILALSLGPRDLLGQALDPRVMLGQASMQLVSRVGDVASMREAEP